jgi:hypothetical protein
MPTAVEAGLIGLLRVIDRTVPEDQQSPILGHNVSAAVAINHAAPEAPSFGQQVSVEVLGIVHPLTDSGFPLTGSG